MSIWTLICIIIIISVSGDALRKVFQGLQIQKPNDHFGSFLRFAHTYDGHRPGASPPGLLSTIPEERRKKKENRRSPLAFPAGSICASNVYALTCP